MSKKTKALEFENVPYTINVEGRHVLVTDAMKDYAIDKLSKIEKYANPRRIIDVHVVMDIQKLDHRVEVILKINNQLITTHTTTDDMYKSIDEAERIVSEQLRRYKSKLQDHKGPSVAEVDMNVNILSVEEDELKEVNEEIQEENRKELIDKYQLRVVSQETLPLKTLTEQEALRNLFISKEKFLVFRSEENHHLCIIYQRRDGKFAIIEPEGVPTLD